MKIHCVCVVRDEADILGHTLDAALEWASGIYALDNGSTDGTWELLQSYARRYPQIELVGRKPGKFYSSFVGEVANQFLHRARRGDWWCRLDADELYVEDPRPFLAGISWRHQVVYAICINYFFTDEDLALYERDPSAYVERWAPERMQFYTTNWSDVRFVRHIPGVDWPDEWPRNVWHRRPAPQRILMRHYDYRSPPQMERRIQIRMNNTEDHRFAHEKMKIWAPMGMTPGDVVFPGPEGMEGDFWRSRVMRASSLYRDNGKDPLRINWDLVTPIWPPVPLYYRVAKKVWRSLKRMVRHFSRHSAHET